MRIVHLDCPVGLGGDMFLAALAGLGLELGPLAEALGEDVARDVSLRSEVREGMAGVQLFLDLPQGAFRHLGDILGLLDAMSIPETVRSRAARALTRLAEVEAAVHGMALEKVHFHEIGAADTIVDVVGAFWALERLDVERVTCSSLPWFGSKGGSVDCAHGKLPLPAPATVKLLHGKPVYPTDFEKELITPTGALLLDQCVDAYASGPLGRMLGSSLAYGATDFGAGAGLRAYLLEAPEDAPSPPLPEGAALERIWVLESNLDHLNGEDLGHCFEALFAAGALDVAYIPMVMKKNRPAGMLQTVCAHKDLHAVQDAFFRNTLTLGLRRREMERIALPRAASRLDSPWGQVGAKIARYQDETWTAPEFEALRVLSRKTGKSPALLRRLLAGSRISEKQGPEGGEE